MTAAEMKKLLDLLERLVKAQERLADSAEPQQFTVAGFDEDEPL